MDSFENEEEEISKLKLANKNLWDFLKDKGVTNDLDDFDSIYDLFYDEDMIFGFIEKFRKFTKALNNVFPKKEALEYLSDFKKFSEINVLAYKHIRDNRLSMKGVSDKLRVIADEYLISKGIDQKIPPISIIDEEFQKNVKKIKRKRTKAAEVEHAIRHYIDENYEEDPELYASFSDILDEILRKFRDNWDKVYEKLEKLRQRIKNADKEPTYGLHRKKQMPFFRSLKKEIHGDKKLCEEEINKLVDLTQNLYYKIDRELKLTDFWDSPPAINRLKGELQEVLLSKDFHSLPNIESDYKKIISRLMEIAERNNDTILYS